MLIFDKVLEVFDVARYEAEIIDLIEGLLGEANGHFAEVDAYRAFESIVGGEKI